MPRSLHREPLPHFLVRDNLRFALGPPIIGRRAKRTDMRATVNRPAP
jgi:hypothetical protein